MRECACIRKWVELETGYPFLFWISGKDLYIRRGVGSEPVFFRF